MKTCHTGRKPSIFHRQANVYKPVEENCSSFCIILSTIGTTTYDLAKFLVPILKSLTENEYTLHDSFSFASEARKNLIRQT